MKEPLTGIQLYTLRRYTKTYEDLDATLARLASFGVRDVQFSAIGPEITPQQQKELLDRYGMRVCVTHQNYAKLCDELPAVIEAHKIIGCDSVGLGYTPEECRSDERAARDYIKKLTQIAETIRANGLTFHYHNHAFEFDPIPGCGCSLMELLLHETDPQTVKLIPDVAWIAFAGHDPAAFLQQNAQRVKVVHFKDYVPGEPDAPSFVSLGKGVVDLQKCFEVCCAKEIPYVMYEQDSGWVDDDPFLATQQALDFFDRLHAGTERSTL